MRSSPAAGEPAISGDSEFGWIDRREDDQQREQGERHQAVGDAHQQGIGRSANVACGQTDGRADHRRCDSCREPDQQRGVAALQ
jgi:hypothetical protein